MNASFARGKSVGFIGRNLRKPKVLPSLRTSILSNSSSHIPERQIRPHPNRSPNLNVIAVPSAQTPRLTNPWTPTVTKKFTQKCRPSGMGRSRICAMRPRGQISLIERLPFPLVTCGAVVAPAKKFAAKERANITSRGNRIIASRRDVEW